jgi:hypothetical protein
MKTTTKIFVIAMPILSGMFVGSVETWPGWLRQMITRSFRC